MSATHGVRDRDRLLPLLERFGGEAVSFLGVESRMMHWFEGGPQGGPRACVAYVDTGTAWVAAGAPLAEPDRLADVAAAFVRAARAAGRRACFFCAERQPLDGFSSLLLGLQPVWRPSEWPSKVATHRRLREQVRRAHAKGVRVRPVGADELRAGSALREEVEALARQWLASRHMEPMGFLVALEMFHLPEEHRYFAAEREGRVVAFLSAVPVYAARGWLVEDVVRDRDAPNGTTEALVDSLMRAVAGDDFVTLGLAPLAGPVSPWLGWIGSLSRPLYDFRGIYDFKQRLHPSRWDRVWLVHPRAESSVLHVLESLRAFAGGSLIAFAARSLWRHPSAPPWALALPLVPWTALLAVLELAGQADVLGLSRSSLAAWIGFDATLVVLLLRSALRPGPRRLAVSTAAAALDAAWSVPHLVWTGLGKTASFVVLRAVSVLAPCFGAAILAWATAQAFERARS